MGGPSNPGLEKPEPHLKRQKRVQQCAGRALHLVGAGFHQAYCVPGAEYPPKANYLVVSPPGTLLDQVRNGMASNLPTRVGADPSLPALSLETWSPTPRPHRPAPALLRY